MKESPRERRGIPGVGGEGALVILGSSGNLARTRIMPSVLSLGRRGLLPSRFVILGVDIKPTVGGVQIPSYRFLRGDLRSQNTFSALRRMLDACPSGSETAVMFYLATRPELFARIVRGLRKEGLSRSGLGQRRIMVEKPFGVDLDSARVLERTLRSAFPTRNIFRVDHFLGKAGTEQIRRARFNLPRLEPVWNRRFIDHVQILADESIGVGARGAFYDSTGAVRDMVQNHLLQLLCLVAIEPSGSSSPSGVARSKARVLNAVAMPLASEVVWGQYAGYNQAEGVRRNTRTPTFAAMKVVVDNDRWRGVPFYLRTGKALARTATEVVVVFRDPMNLPKEVPAGLSSIRVCIDPVAGLVIEAQGKARALSLEGPGQSGDEYEGLLWDAFNGKQERFVDARFNPLSWRLLAPLLNGWEKAHAPRPVPYEPGTWGPRAADRLLEADGRFWRDGRCRNRSS